MKRKVWIMGALNFHRNLVGTKEDQLLLAEVIRQLGGDAQIRCGAIIPDTIMTADIDERL